MSIRRILVPLVSGPSAAGSLALGLTVARHLQAHLDALFVWPDASESLPAFGEGLSGQVVEDVFRASREAAAEQAANAKRMVEEAARAANVPVVATPQGPGGPACRFLEEQGRFSDVVERAGQLADLIVFSDVNSDSAVVLMPAIEAAVLAARKAALVGPRNYATTNPFGRSVVIGWSGRVEAARAVSAAIPLLALADKVTICTVQRDATVLSGQSMIDYLRLHGVTASERAIDPRGRTPGQTLLEAATDIGADLLVMGGFGHSRLRDIFLGGTTRYILMHAGLPVLLAH